MSATVWSKFFWADWLSDTGLRRCSPAARGLWLDMLCIAAQGEPYGVLASGGRALTTGEIARLAGVSAKRARRMIDELESAKVFSRDDKGRIFSRRMVREKASLEAARRTGAAGGNPLLTRRGPAQGVNPRVNPGLNPGEQDGDNPHKPEAISHKPEAISQTPEAPNAPPCGGPAVQRPLLEQAAAALGQPLPALLKRPAWIWLGDMLAELKEQGCEADRDVWPTLKRVGQRLKEPPASPAYFRAAVLEARDRRWAREGPLAAGFAEWQDRLQVFSAEGVWSPRWGPRPDEAGCLAPRGQSGRAGRGGE